MAGEHYSEPAPEITPQAIRQIIETEIEHLLDVLDYLDPEPDDEDDGTGEPDSEGEPELGSLDQVNQCAWSQGVDGEPSLGSLDQGNQLHWWKGNNHELEDEHDGSEPCSEDEGAECEDEGAQCEDEGAECGEDGCSTRFTPDHSLASWKAEQAHQRATGMEAARVTNDLRKVMLRHGLQPVPHLRVLGGAILKT